MSTCILAVADLPDEPSLVAAASANGIGIMRRCVDAADLLAAAAADPAVPIVLTVGMPRLTADLVQRVRAGSRMVIGLASDDEDERRLHAWGVGGSIRHRGDASASMRELALALDRRPGGVWAVEAEPAPRGHGGLVIAVGGPSGSPGRTTTAIAVGETLAARGMRTCVVDGDLRAPSMTAQLGVVDEMSGIVVACRHAENGTLTDRSLMQCTRAVLPGLAVLAGLSRADRWPDVRTQALREVLEQAAGSFDAVVVDIGPVGDGADEVGMLGLGRESAAQAIGDAADRVLVVGRATMLGTIRLVSELPRLVRRPDALALTGEAGAMAEAQRVLRASGVLVPMVAIPRGAAGLERAVRAGALPRESAARRERRQLDALAALLVDGRDGVRATEGRRRGRRR